MQPSIHNWIYPHIEPQVQTFRHKLVGLQASVVTRVDRWHPRVYPIVESGVDGSKDESEGESENVLRADLSVIRG